MFYLSNVLLLQGFENIYMEMREKYFLALLLSDYTAGKKSVSSAAPLILSAK